MDKNPKNLFFELVTADTFQCTEWLREFYWGACKPVPCPVVCPVEYWVCS
ncbi:MAG: hypothetical protein ACI9ZD_001865, partial [Paracoccaceae bacterium]